MGKAHCVLPFNVVSTPSAGGCQSNCPTSRLYRAVAPRVLAHSNCPQSGWTSHHNDMDQSSLLIKRRQQTISSSDVGSWGPHRQQEYSNYRSEVSQTVSVHDPSVTASPVWGCVPPEWQHPTAHSDVGADIKRCSSLQNWTNNPRVRITLNNVELMECHNGHLPSRLAETTVCSLVLARTGNNAVIKDGILGNAHRWFGSVHTWYHLQPLWLCILSNKGFEKSYDQTQTRAHICIDI